LIGHKKAGLTPPPNCHYDESNLIKEGSMKSLSVFPRRRFVKYLLAGPVLTAAAWDRLTAEVDQSITALNQKYIEDDSPDGVYWEELRNFYAFENRFIMMNNGTCGPMPKPVFHALMKAFQTQMSNPYDVYSYLPTFTEAVRSKLAAFIHADPDEVALVSNTTEGINLIVNGLDMKEEDEVLVTSLEHPGHINPWRLKEKRAGIKIRQVDMPVFPKSVDQIVSAFAAAVTPRTRMISISHTVFITGLIMPIKELSQLAHDKGLLILADSAHGIGMLDLDMKQAGVDFFMSSPYKWLGAPTGIGLLYVRKDALEKVWPTIVSSGWDSNKTAGKLDPRGQRADALLFGLDEALNFNNRIGRRRIEKRIKVLSGYLKRELQKIPGLKLHTPVDAYLSAGLNAFSVEGVDPARLVNYLREKYNLVIRTTGNREAGTYGVRVSTPIYTSFQEADMVIEGVRHLASRKA
jgi:selenocysteine lyase/cysteine desulfurase